MNDEDVYYIFDDLGTITVFFVNNNDNHFICCYNLLFFMLSSYSAVHADDIIIIQLPLPTTAIQINKKSIICCWPLFIYDIQQQ